MSGKLLKKKMTTTGISLKTRTTAFNKRKQCLKKKTWELSTLCDIDACIICVGPDGEIDTWPPEKHKLESMISRYRSGVKEERGQLAKKSSDFSSLKNPSLDEMLDGFSEEELSSLRDELLKKIRGGGEKQSKISEEEEVKREESENKSLIPHASDVLPPENNTVETLDDDDEFLQHLYFDPTVLDEALSSSSDWDWDWNHQGQMIVGSSTDLIYDDPSSMKFDNEMMIEEESVNVYETMDDILLMCQMGSEEQSPSLLPIFDLSSNI